MGRKVRSSVAALQSVASLNRRRLPALPGYDDSSVQLSRTRSLICALILGSSTAMSFHVFFERTGMFMLARSI